MFVSFLFVTFLAWVANLIGLATIIGAFAAGLILHDGFFHYWGDKKEHRFSIKDLIAPLEVILVPIFFILIGMQVKLELFTNWEVIHLAFALLVVSVIGKISAGFFASKNVLNMDVYIFFI